MDALLLSTKGSDCPASHPSIRLPYTWGVTGAAGLLMVFAAGFDSVFGVPLSCVGVLAFRLLSRRRASSALGERPELRSILAVAYRAVSSSIGVDDGVVILVAELALSVEVPVPAVRLLSDADASLRSFKVLERLRRLIGPLAVLSL